MRIFKRVFDSIVGKPGEPAKHTTNSVAPFPSGRIPSASTDVITDITQPPPSVIFQPTADPAEDTESFLEEVAGAFDSAFETACSANTELSASFKETTQDKQAEAAVQDLFVQIAANYAIPLNRFMFELQRGTASKNEIELCRPVLNNVRGAVEMMNLPQTVKWISDLDDALLLGLSSGDQLLMGEIRQQILSSYEALVGIMPEVFRLGDEGQKRDDLIIKSLLKQIPGLGCVTLEKLYRAGLGSLDSLLLANKEDLAAATGIPRRICELICDKVAQHRKEMETLSHDAAHSGWRCRLAGMVNGLRDEIEGDKASNGSHGCPASEEQRRRHQRQLRFLEITVILAEMGELDLVSRMHKLSFKRRLQILDEYLAKPEATV
jgi:DNA repair protein RadA